MISGLIIGLWIGVSGHVALMAFLAAIIVSIITVIIVPPVSLYEEVMGVDFFNRFFAFVFTLFLLPTKFPPLIFWILYAIVFAVLCIL